MKLPQTLQLTRYSVAYSIGRASCVGSVPLCFLLLADDEVDSGTPPTEDDDPVVPGWPLMPFARFERVAEGTGSESEMNSSNSSPANCCNNASSFWRKP